MLSCSPVVVLESEQQLSHSLLWQLERQYFDSQGIKAWNTGAVPHYVTSNSTIAKAYANVILAYLRDSDRAGHLDPHLPLYILELGAGCGRFAFYCLRYLQQHLASVGPHLPKVTYVMSDFTQTNLDYWRHHAHLQPFVEAGLLDFAIVDATDIQTLELTESGRTVTADKGGNPWVVIGNYFFDCLPQDVFTLKAGRLYESLVTLTTDHPDPEGPDLLDHLEFAYTDREISSDYYNSPGFNQLLAHYQTRLDDTVLMFPCTGLHSLHQLQKLAQGQLLFLSADRGYGHLTDLADRNLPSFAHHGNGFSLLVNYHAIGHYAQQLGGTWLTMPHRHHSININGFLFGLSSGSNSQTRQAYEEHILTGGPDDFFTLKKLLEARDKSLSLQEMLAYLRLSQWDSIIFLTSFSALIQQIKAAPDKVFYPDVLATVNQIWDHYYPIQEPQDLPFYLAAVLYTAEYYDEALDYLQESRRLYGDTPGTLYQMALCYACLDQPEAALQWLERTLQLDSKFEAAIKTWHQWQAVLED